MTATGKNGLLLLKAGWDVQGHTQQVMLEQLTTSLTPALSPQAFNLTSLNLGLLICKLGMVEVDSRKWEEGRIQGRHLAWLLHAVNKWLLFCCVRVCFF